MVGERSVGRGVAKMGGYQMKNSGETVTRPDKREAAVCGLFCPSCSIFIGTKEDPERLKRAAENLGLPVQEMECAGCRSDRRTGYCRTCKMVQCAAEKGIDFCGACADYPCEELKQFQAVLPHRIELWKSQERIKEVGYEEWYTEMLEHYACPRCGTVNSAYDKVCRKCGVPPGCRYVELNQDEIRRRLVEMPRILEEFKAKLKG
jgi:ribosomal protein L40E